MLQFESLLFAASSPTNIVPKLSVNYGTELMYSEIEKDIYIYIYFPYSKHKENIKDRIRRSKDKNHSILIKHTEIEKLVLRLLIPDGDSSTIATASSS